MGTGEEALVTLGGGAPWGFRLQGGSQQHNPLKVAKLRKRGKASRAGLCENDVLLSINGRSCSGISHADAMHIIDSSDGTLHIWVKRVSCSPASGSFQSQASLGTSPCARSQESSKAHLQAPEPSSMTQNLHTALPTLRSPEPEPESRRHRGQVESYTSPPDSEAYYGETDSDADYFSSEKQRRQKKKCPGSSPRQSLKNPLKSSADEASEQSEYDSAPEHPRPDNRAPPARSECKLTPQGPSTFSPTAQLDSASQHPLDHPSLPPGVVPRSREVMFQPRRVEAKINIWQPKVEMASYPKTSQPNSHYSNTPQPNSHYSNTPQPNSHYPNTPQPNSHYPNTPQPNSHYPNTPQPNSHYSNTPQPNSHYPNTPQPNSHYPNTPHPNTWSTQPCAENSTNQQGILGTSEADSGFQEVPAHVGSPEQKMLPTATKPNLRDTQLVPMIGPVQNPVDEVLTTTYKEKAKQAKLHRSESVQEKQVKEARTKCKTIASLLTSAPNPHSKGVLMFKKRRQRAKKYTLVSYGSVDEEKQNVDEDGELLPTSESEFDEEAFSDARSLTNQSTGSDWDSSYLDMEKPKSEAQGLTETKGKGVMLFEHQRQRAGEYVVEEPPAPRQHNPPSMKPKSEAEVRNYSVMNGESTWSRSSNVYGGTPGSDTLNNYAEINMAPGVRGEPSLQAVRPSEEHHSQHFVQGPSCPTGVGNRTARPFTPGFVRSQGTPIYSVSAPVLFRPSAANAAPPAPWEHATGQNKLAATFSPPSAVVCRPNAATQPVTAKKAGEPKKLGAPYSPSSAVMSPPPAVMSPPPAVMSPPPAVMSPPPAVMSPPPSMKSPPPAVMSPPPAVKSPPPAVKSPPPAVMSPPPAVKSPPPAVMSPPPAVMSPPPAVTPHSPPLVNLHPPPPAPLTSTATFRISSTLPPQRELGTTTGTTANAQPPSIGSTSSTAWSSNQLSENLATREQRISVPASKTGILQEARRRNTRKPMFTKTEQVKHSPNPELLSMVQNLDEKKPDHLGTGFESGPEEDFLSLGAEASNFMQSQARKLKVPPPVAPKPYLKTQLIVNGSPLVNGNPTSGTFQLKGKGAELFAKRQSRMDKFIVDSVPTYTQPKVPSPTPSLPPTWKYSPNIRAPPPIGYNPIYSPSYPPAASKLQTATSATKTERKWKPAGNQKAGIKAIDFIRRQPYQLNPAMFSFSESNAGTQSLSRSAPSTQLAQQSFTSTKQVPVKTTRAFEIKRFSTPVPTVTPTVIAPRSATTLAEPVWMSAPTSPPPALPKISGANLPAPWTSKQNRRAPEGSQEVTFEPTALHLSPKEDIQQQKKTPVHVPRPRFSAVTSGVSTHTWRPGSV
ncbi:synaptopodin 2-like protein [Heptranchias perlo]|uniref:synaptopodin 2-like protein n=1 Tax=Heptranchias perlo TaxID=212740 RepID=UPI003559BE9D